MAHAKTAVIAEDDSDVRDLIEMVLTQSGFEVFHAEDGPSAIEAVRRHEPLLTTLDVNMPGIDGFAVAKRLREFSQTYLIMITALTEEIDIIRGLEAGADDYLVKPFRPRELRARADSMLRRAAFAVEGETAVAAPPAAPRQESWVAAAARDFALTSPPPAAAPPVPAPAAPAPVVAAPAPAPVAAPPAPVAAAPVAAAPVAAAVAPAPVAPAVHADEPEPRVLRFADLSVDSATGAASLAGRHLDLTQPESELLRSLMRSGRRVRSKADLVLAIRGQQYVTSYFVNEADKKAVEVHVANLRRRLGDDGPTPRYIETVRGVGYRLAERD